ncbi:elongation of very long chain fatty acids protein AAEL008004-like [Odontomachus brunneus]|uniref:elongation of very long chain fatty acids protein AAEL008004-like n=1 Tax=Odontomachus brunneus TaxID=486640 RepID=UPI0013F19D59|nr:elongation of very long chain fatty acids protein AAEL008004-like [Odontomachus brunneus]
MNLEQIYNSFPESDPITGKWPIVNSCYPVLFLTGGYLYFIYIAGPRYMKDRPPYKLKNFIFFYNIFQILANAWFVQEFIRNGWFTKYGIRCVAPDFDSPTAQKIMAVSWWLYQIKIIDYIETCIFVLRKKESQISGLHVYHHISIVMFGWIFLKYFPDVRGAFLLILNCSVHVIMYTYYFCAACGPKIQQIAARIKPYLTTIQMVQFIVALLFLAQGFLPSCETPRGKKILPYFYVNIIIYLVLFYNFYRKNYIKKSK